MVKRVFPFLFILLLCLPSCFRGVKRSEEISIGEIKFEGNHSVSDNKLRELLPINKGDPYIERLLMAGTERIISFYRGKGFFDMRISKREGKFLKVQNEIEMTYYIFEGFRSRIDTVVIEGNTLFTDRGIRRILSVNDGDYYDEAIIGAGEYSLSKEYAEKGYTNAMIRVHRTILGNHAASRKVRLDVEINEGGKVWVRDVRFKGLEGVREKIVKREMKIEENDLYRPSLVYESQSRLYKTELFSDVDIQEKRVTDDSVDLVILFKEDKSKFIQVGFGYESPNKALLLFRWGHLNLFGNLQRLVIDLSLKGNPELEHWEDIRLTYRESYLLNSGFNLVASPALERKFTQKYKESSLSLDIILERPILINSQISFLYDFRRATILEAPNITNRASVRYLYEGRDNIIVPRKGLRLLSQIEYAGGFLGGDNHFNRGRFDIAAYHPLPFGIVFAIRSSVILTFPREEPEEISTDVRLEMGGYGTMRGFEEASIGRLDERGKMSGLDQLLFNLEFRIPVYKRLFSSLFTDVGNLWMNYSDISLRNPHIGVGFGLGYITPIGVVRVDYARALEDIAPDYTGKLYVNFAHPF